ncbi:MAG TPA: discoidin domain-containing protein, partial [Acidimicrobiales bacterium]|nr:discoidin domain-containing protein [Acidimicrobiales bacterium]
MHPTFFDNRSRLTPRPSRKRGGRHARAARLSLVLAIAIGVFAAQSGRSSPASATTASPAAPTCGVADPSALQYSSLQGPSDPVTSLATVSVSNFVISDNEIYVLTPNSLNVYNLSGSLVSSASLPFSLGNAPTDMVVGPDGDVYLFALVGTSFALEKMTPGGSLVWSQPFSGVPRAMFSWHYGSGTFAVAVTIQASAGGPLYNSSGDVVGTEPLAAAGSDQMIDYTTSGGLLVDDGNYVYEYNSSGQETGYFGNSTSGGNAPTYPGAPFAFYQQGFATEIGSTIYVADSGDANWGHGIDAFSTQGLYQGSASANTLGGPEGGSPLQVVGSTIYFATYSGIGSISLSNLQALVSQPQQPTQFGFGDTLGIGAGLSTPVTAGYFPPGTEPTVTAGFDAWWAPLKSTLTLSYEVVDRVQDTTDSWPGATTVPLSDANVNGDGSLSIPLSIPAADQGPGVYLVNAQLAQSGSTVGSTCLTYSVGAAGDPLNFSTLDPGVGYGGPAPERGVELASELGTNLEREQLEWATLLPDCNPNDVTLAACGPSSLVFSNYDPQTEEAAAEAKSLGVNFEIQVADGNPVDTAVVKYGNGLWQQDVEAVVSHFASSAPDLVDFEAWNEPNNTWGSGASYVSQILEPFYEAVQAVNSATGRDDQVVGGTVCGMDIGYWSDIAQAGGFSYLNIVATHPYTSYDRSFEEDGVIPGMVQLQNLMAEYGAASKPIWITEQGFWSDGYSSFYDVGNWVAREWILLRTVGITNWNYVVPEGEFSGPGTSYSLIAAASSDQYVKPAGIAVMTASQLLGKRPYLGSVTTGIPHVYAELFGSSEGSSNDELVLWTDDVASISADVTLASGTGPATIATTDVLGSPGTLQVSNGTDTPLTITAAPIYLSVPTGDTLGVGPAETFGPNLALASAGATASASSTASGSSPDNVIQGTSDATNGGWDPEAGDSSPTITVDLNGSPTIDRIVVAGSSIASVLPGLRNYTVQVLSDGNWTTVAQETNEFFDRAELFSFPPTSASAIRVEVTAIDYSGQAGGLQPWYWTPGFPTTAPIYSVEAYAPGTGAPTRGSPIMTVQDSSSSPQVGDSETFTATIEGPSG